ncbi:uncharacterized protein LOC130851774 isoform X2 [Hippopotamus amphibius kiboko]|uniref:uncharacterized protein LOC130851774 isoform X2 n=1 Tax=Hippopotamus amphibius kiboko TaxID=575201 RepID=UPI00259A13F3|nr:uncharacterized protein LOC130851774 isoform X2 [Hippopotamus amphibius kiboko]
MGRSKKKCQDGEVGRSKKKSSWWKKKSRKEGEEADRKPQGQHKNKLWKFLGRFHRNQEAQAAAIQLGENSEEFLQLVQEGRFLEACQSIASLAGDEQDCSSQYQIVAQGMWQVVQEALRGSGGRQELQPKLTSVVAAVEWARGSSDSSDLGGGLASWDGRLRNLLRNDAEARMPLSSGDQLGRYLEELSKTVEHGLGSQREGRWGARFLAIYRECFQDVLLGCLSTLLACSKDQRSCCELYTWGKETLFGPARETPLDAPSTSGKPSAARNLLDPPIFVTWLSQVQDKLVELMQKRLKTRLENILTCDGKEWANSPSRVFLEIFQLLKGTTDSVQDIGPPITSRVQAMVLETFSKFLKRYQDEDAPRFLQQDAGARSFPQLHVLQNCCILRRTWQELGQELGQAHTPLADLVRDTITAIEDQSQEDLLPRVRSLCQSLLECHFGRKDKDLVQALQSLGGRLEDYRSMHPTPTYRSLVQGLYKVVFGEYIQALVSHLKTLEPRRWGDHAEQVELDILELHKILGKQEDLGDGAPGLEAIGEIFQLGENQGSKSLDEWLASFRDRFPGYVSQQDQPGSSRGLGETEAERCCSCCSRFCKLW